MDDSHKAELQAFDPHSKDYHWMLRVRVVTPNRVYHHYFWRRIGAVALGVVLLGWFALTGGVWAYFKFQRDWQEVSYTDLLLIPWRKDEFRTGLAKHNLALGLEHIEKKDYRYGYALLRSAITRVPDDLKARRTLAVMQVRYGLLPRALDTLVEGARYHPDLEYLKLMFGWLLEAREDERVLAVARELLPATPDRKLEHMFIALQAATAHFQRGRYEEMERTIATWSLVDSLEGQILLAKCDAERGSPERALTRLETQRARFPDRDELFYELIRLQRQLGRQDEARRLALLRNLNNGASPGARIDLLHAYYASDDHAAVSREVERYLADFSQDAAALDMLAWFAATSHQTKLLARLHELATNRELPIHAIALARMQEAVTAERYEDAIAIADAVPPMAGDEVPIARRLVEGLRGVALIGANRQEGRAVLATFLERTRLRAADGLMLSRELELIGATDEARRVLERACALDPFNEAALAALVRIDARTGNFDGLARYVPALLRTRKPPRPVLEETLLALTRPADGALAEKVVSAIATATPTSSTF